MKRSLMYGLPAAALLAAAGVLAGLAPSTGSTPAPAPAPRAESAPATYQVDAVHSVILFKIKHLGITNFYGRFNDFSGSFQFEPANHEAGSFSFEVNTGSVDTGNTKRDDHLRSADFFNSRQFPAITFESTAVEHVEGDTYKLTGDLTMQGETRPVTAELEWLGTGTAMGNREIGAFEARFSVQRGEFGITQYLAPDGSDSGALGNTVDLIVSIEAFKQ